MKFRPDALKDVMKKENIKTQQELADRLGVTRVLVSNILAGKREPGSKFFFSLLAEFPKYDWRYFYKEERKAE